MSLLELTPKGLYCSQADIYIDPTRKVDRAIVTHAHADHARPGIGSYLSCVKGESALRHRLGKAIKLQTCAFGESTSINGVNFSLHPAGHIVGSSQVRVEYKGEVWVVTGDYKIEDDGLSQAYESIKCNVLITESTFALPIYEWPDQYEVVDDIFDWWDCNAKQGKTSVVLTYSLGKAQRILYQLRENDKPMYAHRTIVKTNSALRKDFPQLPQVPDIEKVRSRQDIKGSLVLVPPGLSDHTVFRKMSPFSVGVISGWMAVPGTRRNRMMDRSFTMSDHADWKGLVKAVENSEAEQVYVMHGFKKPFVRWLNENGVKADDISSLRKGKEEVRQ